MFLLAGGLGAIMAIIVSAVFPGGLILQWYKVAGVGCIASLFFAACTFLSFRSIQQNHVFQSSIAAKATGLLLAVLSLIVLLTVAATGPRFVSGVSIVALAVALLLVVIKAIKWIREEKSKVDKSKVSGTD